MIVPENLEKRVAREVREGLVITLDMTALHRHLYGPLSWRLRVGAFLMRCACWILRTQFRSEEER